MMDNTFINHFGGNAQLAKAYALPKVNAAIADLDALFATRQLDFNLIFFPTTILTPNYPGYKSLWIEQINNFFDNQFPCIPRDCIVVLTTAFSSGGGHGHSRVALVSDLGIASYRFVHEVGHNLGLRHPSSICIDDCNPSTFMCGGTVMQFNDCDQKRLADFDTGVFTQTFCNPSCNCNLWADEVSEFPDDYICPPPDNIEFVISTDNPNPVRNCSEGLDESIVTVKFMNNSQAANRNIRVHINNDNSDFVEFVIDPALDFNCIKPLSGTQTELRIVEPVTSGCDDNTEVMHPFGSGETKEFMFKVRYKGGIPPSLATSLNDFAITIYTGSDIGSPLNKKIFRIIPFVEITSSNQWDVNNPLFFQNDIELNGEEVFGSTYDFSMNRKLLFAPGTGLTIGNTQTTMAEVEIRGCDQMWKGITVNYGSEFMADMTAIEDAQSAVLVKRGSIVAVENSNLLNNNFAIRTDPSGTGNFNLTLNSNQYGTTTGLKPAYNGQSPASLSKGFAGIYLENAGTVTIESMFGQPNEFFNLQYGIISKNSNLIVRNSTFQDIEKEPQGSEYGSFVNSFFTGKAIHISGGSLDVWSNAAAPTVNFGNCHTGIQAQNAAVSIWGTSMTSMNNGIIANGGFGKAYNIQWNNITASERGISVFYQSGIPNASNISYNTVRMTGTPNGFGIGTGGQEMFPQYEGTVSNNTVTVEEGETGINISVASRLKVTQNGVSLAGSDTRYGIKIEGGDRNTVNCNTVTNPGGGDNSGVYAVHPSRSSFLCNTADGPARGLHFEGMLAGKAKATVAKNKMKNNGENGLLLGVDAVIGQQAHTGNKWQGGLTSAQHLTPPVSQFSKFIVDNNENTEFMPDLVDPSAWFLDETTSGETNSQCVPGSDCPLIPAIATDAGLERKIAKSEVSGTTYAAAQQWLAQRRLYETLTEDGNPYPSDSDFNNFLSAAQTSGLSQYANVQIGIRQLGSMTEGDRHAASVNLLTANSGLTGSAAYQVNEKTVNEIFLSTIAVGNFSFTETQINTLKAIANSCPLSDGEAVLRARAMLNLLDEAPVTYNDDELCNPSQPRKGRSNTGGLPQRVRLYPNPANSEITIEYRLSSADDNRLSIFNVFGQLVKETAFPDTIGKLFVPVDDLASGVYWYSVSCAEPNALSGKFLITH